MIEDLLKPLVCERFIKEEKYRNSHIRVLNPLPGRVVLGMHIPEMKLFAKEMVKSGKAVDIISDFVDISRSRGYDDREALSFEETMIWGFMINYMKVPDNVRYEMVADFIPVIDNWGVCDSFCSSAKWMKNTDKAVLWDFLQKYYSSDCEFFVRFALVSSMLYFLDEEWIGRVFAKIESLEYVKINSDYTSLKSPYYVRMAAAWLLATALAKFPEKTREFVTYSVIPDDVKKLYARKVRESLKTRNVLPFVG